MNNIFYIFFLFAISFCFAQNEIEVQYDYYYKHSKAPFATEYCSVLNANNEESVFEVKVLEEQQKLKDSYEVEGGGNARVIKEKTNRFFYKNIKEGFVINKHRIFLEHYTVKTPLNVFDWKIENDYKEIIGYKCQKATMHYMGRDYVAYFTTDIPLMNGPWKFHSLPGLILEIHTKDDEMEFRIKATSFKFNKEAYGVYNPYKSEKKILSQEKFIKKYQDKYDQFSRYNGKGGITLSMSKGRIEKYIK